MDNEHNIVALVNAAKNNAEAANSLVSRYLPFIKAETSKFIKGAPVDGSDELSVAMFAFHEAVLKYDCGKGAFIAFAAMAIKNRLIDYKRKESRHENVVYLDKKFGEDEDISLLDKLSGKDEIDERNSVFAAKQEITHFTEQLKDFDLKLTDIAENCPKQKRTLDACHKALDFARENPVLLSQLVSTKKVPISALSDGSGVERKTLERHRKYLVAILLAYTNGFEIIRGHLSQISPQKGWCN